MKNDEIKQAYENFMKFLSLEKGDRNTCFKEVYLNNDIYLFLKYKNIYYFIVHKTITKCYIGTLKYPFHKGIYWEYEKSDLTDPRIGFVEENNEAVYKFKNKEKIGSFYDDDLYYYFWKSIFNTSKIKLNFHCDVKNKLIKAVYNKTIEWFILRSIRKKYKNYIADKKKEAKEIFDANNPTKQSVYVLKNNKGKK